MSEPQFGDLVQVRPASPAHRVQEHRDIPGRIMSDEWTDRTWDDWLHSRWRDGSVQVRARPADPISFVQPIAAKDGE